MPFSIVCVCVIGYMIRLVQNTDADLGSELLPG